MKLSKFLPSNKKYLIELGIDDETAINNLKNNTQKSINLFSSNKIFIGQIEGKEFNLSLTKSGIANFGEFSGRFENQLGEIEIKIHPFFKFFLYFLILASIFTLVSLIIDINENGLADNNGSIWHNLIFSIFGVFSLFSLLDLCLLNLYFGILPITD